LTDKATFRVRPAGVLSLTALSSGHGSGERGHDASTAGSLSGCDRRPGRIVRAGRGCLARHDGDDNREGRGGQCGCRRRYKLTADLFPAPDGGPVRASLFRRRVWYPACVKAGYGTLKKDLATGQKHYEGLRLHDLRHSAVALWIAAGASPKEVAVRAGHTSVSVVLDRYGHLLPGTEERVTDALDAMAKAAFLAPKPADVASIR
jgi:hypothetical protein